MCDLQEREKKGETWAPRWFRKPADKTVLPNEYSEEEVPMWEFTGEGFNQPKPSAPSDGEPLSCQIHNLIANQRVRLYWRLLSSSFWVTKGCCRFPVIRASGKFVPLLGSWSLHFFWLVKDLCVPAMGEGGRQLLLS